MTGLRQADILQIKHDAITPAGVRVETSKSGNTVKILIEWSARLKRIVNKAKEYSTARNSSYLFCNTKGKPYTSDGFRTIWYKLIAKATSPDNNDEIRLSNKFTFHDIRRKTATDLEQLYDREHARKLLGHADQKTTGIYISGYQPVKGLD